MMADEFYFKPGERLRKHYIIQCGLAKGGFGEVYAAFDEHLGCKVAIKRVFAQLNSEQIRQEVTILVNHARTLGFMPNVYDHWKGERGAGYFIVMDFVEGKTLDKVQSLPWESSKVIAFLRIMLKNLHDLHSRGIIHCDIKPVNIKATPPSDLFSHVPYMLLDFGIAKQGNTTTIFACSPEYAAIEQYPKYRTNHPDLRIDPRTDLYSLAATAYYLVTGKSPVDAEQRFVYALLGKDDTYVSADAVSIVASMHPGLKATLSAMMQVLREKRPPNALAALILLEEQVGLAQSLESDLPPDSSALSAKPGEQPESQPDRGASPSLPAYGQAHPAPHESEQSENNGDDLLSHEEFALVASQDAAVAEMQLPIEVASQDAAVAAMELPVGIAPVDIRDEGLNGVELQAVAMTNVADIHSLALLPEGQTFAALGTALQIWTVETDAVTPGSLIDLDGERPRAIAARPDGQMLALVTGERVHLHRMADGAVLGAGTVHLAQARGMTFSSSGEALLLIEADAIAMYDVSTVAPVAQVELGEARTLDHVVLAARGNRVALNIAGQIVLRSLAEGADCSRVMLSPGEEVTALALTPDGNRLAVATFDALAVWQVGDRGVELIDRQRIAGQAGAHALVFGSDGNLLATLHDRDAHFWRVEDSGVEYLAVARGHTARIHDIVVVPAVTGAITVASDRTLRLWRLPDTSIRANH